MLNTQLATAVEETQQQGWQLPPEPEELTRARQALRVLLPRVEQARREVAKLEAERQSLTARLADPATDGQEVTQLREQARGQAALVLSARDELDQLEANLANARGAVGSLRRDREKELLAAGQEAEAQATQAIVEAVKQLVPSFYNHVAEVDIAIAQLTGEAEGVSAPAVPTQSRHGFARRATERALRAIIELGQPALKSWVEVFKTFDE